MSISRPTPQEFAPYYQGYVDLVKGDAPLALLEEQAALSLLEPLHEADGDFAYAEGKWTIKELMVHLVDCERIFAYRALALAREEQQALPGFDQDDYVLAANAGKRSLASLLEEYSTLRQANLALFRSFDAAALARQGTVSGGPMSVRALIYIVAGHEVHHLAVLRSRYLNQLAK